MDKTTRTAPTTAVAVAEDQIDQSKLRLAKNIYELYGLSREDRRDYIAKWQQEGVNEATLQEIRKVFRLAA